MRGKLEKIWGVIQVGRLWNIFVLEAVVILGSAFLLNGYVPFVNYPLLILVLSAGLAMSSGTVLDDVVDQMHDSNLDLQHKRRPLGSKIISKRDALSAWLIFVLLSIGLVASLGTVPLIGSLCVVFLGLIFSYGPRLKYRFFLDELTISLVFITEILVVSYYFFDGFSIPALILVLFSIPAVFVARSIEGLIDYDYDIKAKRRTLQTMFGFRRSLLILLVFLITVYGLFIPLFYVYAAADVTFLLLMAFFCFVGVISLTILIKSYRPINALWAYRLGRLFALGAF